MQLDQMTRKEVNTDFVELILRLSLTGDLCKCKDTLNTTLLDNEIPNELYLATLQILRILTVH